MAKRRRVKKNVASNNKGKTSVQVKTLEKDDGKVTCVETLQPSDAKKQKLDTSSSRTDSSLETELEKYVPPFTASQRVVRVPRDKLQLNKTKINSQENNSTEEGKALKSGDTASNEDYNTKVKEQEKLLDEEQQEDDSVGNEEIKEVEISAINSLNDGKDKATSVLEYYKDKESILKTNESTEIANKDLLESDQIIVNKELSNDVKAINFKSQTDEAKPEVVEVPKLSFIIKKYYVDIEPHQDLKKVEPVVLSNTSNLLINSGSHQEQVEENEKEEENEIRSTELEGSEIKSMNVVDDQILSQPSATVESNLSTCSQNYIIKQVIVICTETECVQNGNGKQAITENTSTEGNEDEQSDDLSKVPLTSDDLVDQQTGDQRVPGDFDVQECQAMESGSYTMQEAVDPDEKKIALSCLNESNCEKRKEDEVGDVLTSAVAHDNVVDKQSFAKEFEELEELLPKDDMGLFDDVMDQSITSDEIEIPDGDSTMQFLTDELSSLNYMVMNYQRNVDEMKRQYKLSNRC